MLGMPASRETQKKGAAKSEVSEQWVNVVVVVVEHTSFYELWLLSDCRGEWGQGLLKGVRTLWSETIQDFYRNRNMLGAAKINFKLKLGKDS